MTSPIDTVVLPILLPIIGGGALGLMAAEMYVEQRRIIARNRRLYDEWGDGA